MAETKTAPVAKTNGVKKEEEQKSFTAKRTDEDLKKMGVTGTLIAVTKKAVKLAKKFNFEGLDVPEDVDAEGAFYRLHKIGGVIERIDPKGESFTKLRELAKKAIPDMIKYAEGASDATNKPSYSGNVKAYLKFAVGIPIERTQRSLEMSALQGMEL